MKCIIATIAMMAAICLAVSAAPLSESQLTREGMKNAFEEGMSTFGGRIKSRPLPIKESDDDADENHIYSLYTKDIKSPSGGKPALAEQYVNNNYIPLAPTVIPRELPPSTGNETPGEAAERYVPQRPYQFTTDRLRV